MKEMEMVSSKAKPNVLKLIFEALICIYYAWFFLPVLNALLWNNTFKLLFFGCFAIGCVGLLLLNGIRINTVMTSVLAYFAVMLCFWMLGVGDANAHIRVSFTFWGTALLYFGILDQEGKLRIGKFLLFLVAVTALTSAIGVFVDNSAARTIAHAAADEELQTAYRLRNISSIYLFQGLVFFVPPLICLPKTAKGRFCGIAFAVVIFFVLLNASFTIALLVFAAAAILSLMIMGKGAGRLLRNVLLGGLLIVVLLNLPSIFHSISQMIDNPMVASRLQALADVFSGNDAAGDALQRAELYDASLRTFLSNPFGLGPLYSYQKFDNGIGYHSQFLDDLARYGIFALTFYAVFLIGYYKQLRKTWQSIGQPRIAFVTVVIYGIFLVMNLGFRSAAESVIMLFVLPELPLLLQSLRETVRKKHPTEREVSAA